MIVVSQNVFMKTPLVVGDFPKDTVLRVNLAWEKDLKSAKRMLTSLFSWDVYLDYPQGRTKPPKPTIKIAEAIDLAKRFENVKYFAISNVEDSQTLNYLRNKLRKGIEIVPKIETLTGVRNLPVILDRVPINHIMLDKEDLYLDVNKDIKIYEKCIKDVRKACKAAKVDLLELQGVLFA